MTRKSDLIQIPPAPKTNDKALRDFNIAIKQILETYQGNIGNVDGLDRVIRLKDISDYIDYDGITFSLAVKIISSLNIKAALPGNLVESNSSEEATNVAGTVKVKEITIARTGTYRIKFWGKETVATATGRIYKNGSALGTARTFGANWAEWSEDLSGWVKGDLAQIYIAGNGKVRDFRICVSDVFTSGVNLSMVL